MWTRKLAHQSPQWKAATYALVIDLSRAVTVNAGKLGAHRLQAGTYIYAGGARRGFNARVARHLSKKKRLHWHVDYLLASKYATVIKVWAFSADISECDIISILKVGQNITAPIKSFGASDCRNRCPAHLLRSSRSVVGVLKKLGGKLYDIY